MVRVISYMTSILRKQSELQLCRCLKMETQDREVLCFPHLSNISCRKPVSSLSEFLLLRVLLTFISVITVVLNLLVIISVSHFRQITTNFSMSW